MLILVGRCIWYLVVGWSSFGCFVVFLLSSFSRCWCSVMWVGLLRVKKVFSVLLWVVLVVLLVVFLNSLVVSVVFRLRIELLMVIL